MANGKWCEVVLVGVQDTFRKPPEYIVMKRILDKPLKKNRYHKIESDSSGYKIGIIVPEIFDNKEVYLNRIKSLTENGFTVERAGYESSRVSLDEFNDDDYDYDYDEDYFYE